MDKIEKERNLICDRISKLSKSIIEKHDLVGNKAFELNSFVLKWIKLTNKYILIG